MHSRPSSFANINIFMYLTISISAASAVPSNDYQQLVSICTRKWLQQQVKNTYSKYCRMEIKNSMTCCNCLSVCYSHAPLNCYAHADGLWTVSGMFPNCSRRICEIDACTTTTAWCTARNAITTLQTTTLHRQATVKHWAKECEIQPVKTSFPGFCVKSRETSKSYIVVYKNVSVYFCC